jgi:hypothetical protein
MMTAKEPTFPSALQCVLYYALLQNDGMCLDNRQERRIVSSGIEERLQEVLPPALYQALQAGCEDLPK